jgi:hypothetical protein
MPTSYVSNVVGQLPESAIALDANTGDLVGLASLFGIGSSTAELGVLIQDDHQRLGIGTDLTKRLLRHAVCRGITMIRGSILRDRLECVTLVRTLLGDIELHNDGIITNFRASLGAADSKTQPSSSFSYPEFTVPTSPVARTR